jgi:hypothetical protein
MRTHLSSILYLLLLLFTAPGTALALEPTTLPLVDAQRLGTHFDGFPAGVRWEGARLEWSDVDDRAIAVALPSADGDTVHLPLWHEARFPPVDPGLLAGGSFDATLAEMTDHVVRLDHAGVTRWLLIRAIRVTAPQASTGDVRGLAVLIAVSRSQREAERVRTGLTHFADATRAPEPIGGGRLDLRTLPGRDSTEGPTRDRSCSDCSFEYERDISRCDRAYYYDVAAATAVATVATAACVGLSGPSAPICQASVLTNLANDLRQAKGALTSCLRRARDHKQLCLLQCDAGFKGLF